MATCQNSHQIMYTFMDKTCHHSVSPTGPILRIHHLSHYRTQEVFSECIRTNPESLQYGVQYNITLSVSAEVRTASHPDHSIYLTDKNIFL